MEVSLLTESANDLIKTPILDYNSNHLPITSRAGKLVLAEQESADKCNHFTIRGYVSEVRKKNAKNCLPFPTLEQSSADHVNVLPPLQVKRFRRWNCQRCAQEIIVPAETVTPNEANMTSQSDGLKNHGTLPVEDATKASNCEVAKSFARSQQQIESSVLIKEGTRLSKVCYHRLEDDQNRTSKPNAETCQTREKEGTNTIRASSSRIALLSEDNPKILSSKRDITVMVHPNEISDKEQDQGLSKIGRRKELGSHVEIPKNGALTPSPDPMLHRYSKNLDRCSDEESDTSIHFIDARKPDVSLEKSCPKRAHKIRTLDDIMKSTALRKVAKNCISSEDIGAGGSGSIQIPEASRDNDEHPKHRGHLIQDKEPMSIKRKNKEAIPNDGERTCLIHWLKKVPKKARLHKGQLEAKDINTAASTSKCASLKGADRNHEYFARVEKKKQIIGENKRIMMPEVGVVKSSFIPQKESIAHRGHIITEDLQTKNSHSRSPGIVSEKDLLHKTGTIENNYKKTLLGNKKNKRPLLKDGASSQIRCFKDSLSVQKQIVIQTHSEVKKKRRIMRTPEREGVDDIPMDIVEHLAKKQHEKYMMNTKDGSSNLSKLPEPIENVKNLNGCNNAGCDAQISTINNEDTESRSKSKQYHRFDLNQEASTCASAELQSPSPYIGLSMSGAQLTIIDSNRNYFPQNLSAVGMKTLPCRSDHMSQAVSPQNLFGNAHDGGSFGLLNGYPSQINAQNISSSFVYPSPESRNGCYSNVMAPGDLHFNGMMSASNFLRIVNQSAHSGDPRLSLLHNGYTNTFTSHGSEFLRSEIDDKQGGNMCKPLRPLPRIGVLGPLLQKEITNTSNNIGPTLGFGANSQLSFHNTSFIASNPKLLTSHMATEKVMNTQTSISQNESLKRVDNNGQVATNSRNGAFQPLKSSFKMEECVVNRNPADFAMADEDSEYMMGYKETKAKDRMPHSGKLQSQTHIRRQKGQKMRKLSELKRSRKSYKASSRGKV